MTPRSLASKVRLAAVVLVAGASPDRDQRLRPAVSRLFPPAVRAHDRARLRGLARGQESRHSVQRDLRLAGGIPSLERDITREFASILKKKVKKITVVDPDKVATWVEAHPHWTDPADAARDFDADIAIFLEVEQFQIQSPGDLNMVHGESKVHIQVFEMQYPKNSKDKPIKDQPKEATTSTTITPRRTFPESRSDPDRYRDQPSRSSRITFLKIVAKEISWHFVEHAEDDSIQDSRIEK